MIGAYFTNWANYHSAAQNTLMPDQIPLSNLNTIYYDVATISNQTADVGFSDINRDQYYIPAFAALKQQYPYLNLVLSFGGWGSGSNFPSYDLATIFDQQNPKLIQTLAINMVNTIRELGFNGIDIDYEWNAIQPGGGTMDLTPARAQGFQELLQDIRADLNAIQPSNNPHYYKLTAAVFAGTDSIDKFVNNGGNWTKVAAAVDYLDVMTYDMHGQWDINTPAPDNITGFLSGMQTSHSYSKATLNHYTVTSAVAAYEKQGVPAAKLIMGLPAYTRIEKAAVPITAENQGLYVTLATDQPDGESGPGSGGVADYKCIVNPKFCWNNFSFTGFAMQYVPTNLSDNGPGALAKTPWAYSTLKNWFMSYDDGVSAQYKGQWASKQGLGGVMVWEIDGDVPASDKADYKKQSIIYNAWKGLETP